MLSKTCSPLNYKLQSFIHQSYCFYQLAITSPYVQNREEQPAGDPSSSFFFSFAAAHKRKMVLTFPFMLLIQLFQNTGNGVLFFIKGMNFTHFIKPFACDAVILHTFLKKKLKNKTHVGLFTATSFINPPTVSHDLTAHFLLRLLFPPCLWQGESCRICLSMKWFTPLEWMPEVTSCPTSCLTMLAVCSAGKPRRDQRTWIESSTSCGTATTVCTLTSHSTHTCWLRVFWQREGTVAWREPKFVLLDHPSAIS